MAAKGDLRNREGCGVEHAAVWGMGIGVVFMVYAPGKTTRR